MAWFGVEVQKKIQWQLDGVGENLQQFKSLAQKHLMAMTKVANPVICDLNFATLTYELVGDEERYPITSEYEFQDMKGNFEEGIVSGFAAEGIVNEQTLKDMVARDIIDSDENDGGSDSDGGSDGYGDCGSDGNCGSDGFGSGGSDDY